MQIQLFFMFFFLLVSRCCRMCCHTTSWCCNESCWRWVSDYVWWITFTCANSKWPKISPVTYWQIFASKLVFHLLYTICKSSNCVIQICVHFFFSWLSLPYGTLTWTTSLMKKISRNIVFIFSWKWPTMLPDVEGMVIR